MPRRAAPRRRRTAIRLLAMVTVAMLAVAGWRASTPARFVTVAWSGAAVVNAPQVLRQAEVRLRAELSARHGALSPDTRCYFAVSTTGRHNSRPPQTGTVDIGPDLQCGPALFVDGDLSRPYLGYRLQAQASSPARVRLTLSPAPVDAEVSLPASQLLRPDGRRPTMAVRVPLPPPANPDVLSTATVVGQPLSPTGPDAVMIGATGSIRLTGFGFISRYSSGDAARSAPPGRRLLAFSMQQLPGEIGNVAPTLAVRVGAEIRGPLRIAAGYVVTSVPDSAPTAELLLGEGASQQSLSLTTGKPATANPQVTRRTTVAQHLSSTDTVTVRLTAAGKSGISGATAHFSGVRLSYWAADGTHASGPDSALLHILATLQLDDDRRPYGTDPGLITVVLPDGRRLTARNAALNKNAEVDDVVEVPANITGGTVLLTGLASRGTGSLAVRTPVQVPFRIPLG